MKKKVAQKETTLKSWGVKILQDMLRVLEKGGLTYPHLRAGEEMKQMKSMTNTFDFPLMSVSALYRHTSSRSSLAETAKSALFHESKCISKNYLTAESKGFEAT